MIFNESDYNINIKNVIFLFFELRKTMRSKSFKVFFKKLKKNKKRKSIKLKA